MNTIKHIACLGAGTIGSSWAAFFASKGFSVRLYDADPQTTKTGFKCAQDALKNLHVQGILTKEELDQGLTNIQAVDALEELLQNCDYVQESIIEDYAIKTAVYAELEQYVEQEAIIASSTSGLLMTRIQKDMQYPQRAIIVHPFNPPHLIPLVELVPGELTDPNLTQALKVFFEGIGKTPVVLNKEIPGHIANRLAAALWREALHLVSEGVASVEDVDKALSAGPGLRWALMGQHMIYQIGGGSGGYEQFIDGIGASFGAYWETMPNWSEIPSHVRDAALSGMDECLQGKNQDDLVAWRDEKLANILRILQD